MPLGEAQFLGVPVHPGAVRQRNRALNATVDLGGHRGHRKCCNQIDPRAQSPVRTRVHGQGRWCKLDLGLDLRIRQWTFHAGAHAGHERRAHLCRHIQHLVQVALEAPPGFKGLV